MFRTQLKLALRNLTKRKSFSLINIFGLSLGMACCFLIILYYWHEVNYDTFHKNGDQLYRVEYVIKRGDARKMARTPPAIAPAMGDLFPEVEAVSRFYPREISIALPQTKEQFEVEDVFFVDSTALQVFDFDFIYGDAKRALDRPNNVVLSDAMAMQLFGSTKVLGKPLRLAGEEGFEVAGVVKAWPDNAHLSFNMLLPFNAMISVEPPHARERAKSFIKNNWTATHSYTYVKLKPNQEPQKVNDRFAQLIAEKGNENLREIQAFTLLPIKAIHLAAQGGGPKPSGNLNYLYLFLFIGILTLLIACINFINLSTASSMTRAKEISVRKVLGAQRSSLIAQFLGESILLSFLSFLVSLILVQLALPYLNELTGIAIPASSLSNPLMLGLFSLIFLLTGFLAGLYPAIFVSRFKPGQALKSVGGSQKHGGNTWLRKGLITLQFLAAIGFISGALTLYLQIRHLSNQPLGFNQELLLSLPLNSSNNLNAILRPGDADLRKRMNAFDESLLNNPNIKAVTQCSQLPGRGTVSRHIASSRFPITENISSNVLSVDYDFTETFELSLVAGRDFDASFGTDHISSFLINEQTVNLLEWETPENAVGQKLEIEGKEGVVVGVLKDFHFESLHSEIDPLVMEVRPGGFSYFALRVEHANLQETLSFINDKWIAAFPEKVFEYSFLDDILATTYQAEKRLATIIGYAAFITIFISCFGLFGLAALMTQQRFKEIGIRKVLGASANQILQLISKDFIKLIILAMLIALPLCWYTLNHWLSDFAYRIDFPWWVTIASGLAVMLLAFITISAQTMRAAFANPVDAIREE